MIRFKSIKEVYPNGLTFVEYHQEDIPLQPWYGAICRLIELIKKESRSGWRIIFYNFVSSCKASVFYPVMTSFEDWNEDYSINSDIIKFHPQQEAIREYFKSRSGTEAGELIYPPRTGRGGSRWIFGDQITRIKGYSEADLKGLLYDVAYLGGAIPVSGWENSFSYGEKVKTFCSNYSEYLEAAYLLPPSWYLMDNLQEKRWLKILIASGVLRDGLLRTPRGYRCIAKDGHECNSLAELEIDNWLYKNRITHQREPTYPEHPKYNPDGRLRADFKVGDCIIEYAGLLDDPVYAKKMQIKKRLAKDLDIRLIILTPRDLSILEKALNGVKG
jgi:hypothetical protein